MAARNLTIEVIGKNAYNESGAELGHHCKRLTNCLINEFNLPIRQIVPADDFAEYLKRCHFSGQCFKVTLVRYSNSVLESQ